MLLSTGTLLSKVAIAIDSTIPSTALAFAPVRNYHKFCLPANTVNIHKDRTSFSSLHTWSNSALSKTSQVYDRDIYMNNGGESFLKQRAKCHLLLM
jgi:hypothetical protein